MTVKTFNGKAIASVKTINGKAIAAVKTINGNAVATPVISLYWVGGTASWDGTAGSKWALTSGGTGGEAVPVSTNPVFLDANSGASTVTIATVPPVCKGLDCTGFTGTLAGSQTMTNKASLLYSTGMTRTYSGSIVFTSTAAGNTITTNGKGTSILTFNGAGGVWTIQDNLTATTMTLTNGSLDFNGKAVSANTIQSATGTCTLTFGAATVGIATALTLNTSGITISAASSTINFTANGTFNSKSATYGTVNFTTTQNSLTPLITNSLADGAITFGTLTRTGAAYTGLFLNTNIVVSAQLTATGTNANLQRTGIINLTAGALTVTCNGSATITNADFAGVTVSGSAAPISGTSIGDFGGNSGITFTTPVTRYLVTGAGSNDYMSDIWAASSGGSPDGLRPLGQDTIVIDSNSFASGSRTLDLNTYRIGSLDFSNATNNPTLTQSSSAGAIYGNITLKSGMTVTAGGVYNFTTRTTQAITSNGVTWAGGIIIRTSGTVSLGDDLTNTINGIQIQGGTFADNNHNVTATTLSGNIAAVGLTVSFAKGTGVYTLTGTGTVLNFGVPASLTFSDAGTTKLTNNSSSAKTFAGGGKTFNIVWNATAGTGIVTISGSNTFSELKSDASRTTNITSGTTQTISTLTLGATCTIGASSTAGYTLINTSGIPWASTGTVVSKCTCTGGWVVTGGTDGGGNTGVTFI